MFERNQVKSKRSISNLQQKRKPSPKEDQFLQYSKCAADNKQKNDLLKILQSKKKSSNIKSTIIYRGSDHGWKPEDFHSRCDKMGPTICLFKAKDGDCFGGYTS
jgi:hypothetical protein